MTQDRTVALLDAVLDAAPDGIIIADHHGLMLRTNRAAESLFGYRPGELVGQSVNILMPQADAGRHDGYVARHLETGTTRIIGVGRELVGRRRDGTTFPVHLSVGRAEVEGEVRFVAILHDLSLRHAQQAAIERSMRLEALGQMTGGVAHDFNNLLTIVTGNLELLEGQEMGEPARAMLSDAHDAARLAADLTGQLMTFARQGPLVPEDVEVNRLIERMTGLLRRTLGPAHQLRVALAEGLPPLVIDAAQVQAALMNLTLNAQDAMADKAGTITIETASVHIDDRYIAQETDIARGDYVRISVSDTGQGMDRQTRMRALEPFFTTKPAGKGTGLGLATVYGFVRQSGGHMTLYSEPGQGTTVAIYLPVAPDDDAAALSPAGEDTEGTTGIRVLVVEDDATLRALTVSRLEALGFRTLAAATGDDAAALVSEGEPFDLLFTDLVMPGTRNGLDLAELVADARPGTAILLTSGFAGRLAEVEQAARYPLLRKPYRQKDLAAAVEAALAARDQMR